MYKNMAITVDFITRQVSVTTGADTLLLLSYSAKTIPVLKLIESQSQIDSVCGLNSPMGIEANQWFRYGGRILAVNLWGGGFTTRPAASYPIDAATRTITLPDTQVKNVSVSISGTPQTLNTHYTQNLEKGTITFFPNLAGGVTAATVTYDYPNYTTPTFPLTLNPNEPVDSIFLTTKVTMDATNLTLLQGYAEDLRAYIFVGLTGTATAAISGRYDNTKWWSDKDPRTVLVYPQTLTADNGVTTEPSALHMAGALSRNKFVNKWNGIEGLEILGANQVDPVEYSTDLVNNGISTFERLINQPTRTLGQYTSAFVGDTTDPLRFFSTLQTRDEIYSVIVSVDNRYRGREFTEDYIQLINSVLYQELRALGGIYDVRVVFDRPNMVVSPTNLVTLPYIVSYKQRNAVELMVFTVILEIGDVA